MDRWHYKEAPEDFQVREVIDLSSLKQGKDYCWLLMEKENLTTLQALSLVASKLGISRKEFFWAGEKDRWAITWQYVGVRRRAVKHMGERALDDLDWKVRMGAIEGRVRLRFVGWFAQPPKLSMIRANEFKVRLRSSRRVPVDLFEGALSALREGMLNYYDSQRFGARGINHVIGYLILAGRWEEALKKFVCYVSSDEGAKVRRFRRKLLRSWDEFLKGSGVALELLRKLPLEMDMERSLLRALLNFKSPDRAFKTLPKKIFKLFLNSLQSAYFNMSLSAIVEERVRMIRRNKVAEPLITDEGVASHLYMSFPVNPYEHVELMRALRREEIPLPGLGTTLPDGFPRGKELLKLRLMGSYRNAVVVPEGLEGELTDLDEGVVLSLRFRLPRGSYATVLMRSLVAML